MRKLVVLVILGAALVGADLGAKSYTQAQIARRIEASVEGDRRADVSIDSVPYLGRLLASGSAGTVTARMDRVDIRGLTFTTVGVELVGVKVDRDRLLRRHVSITDIDSGTVTADLTAVALTEALGLPVSVKAGAVDVTLAGQVIRAEASVDDNVLRLRVAPLPMLSIPIPKSPLLPCATGAIAIDDRIRITCTLDQVPPALVEATNEPIPAD